MTGWQWAFFGLAGIGLIELLVFVYLYARRSIWRDTPAGKALMAVMFVLVVLYGLIFVSRLLDGLGPVAWSIALGALDVVIFQWLRLLHREQRATQEVDK
jgi:hypothetical protein